MSRLRTSTAAVAILLALLAAAGAARAADFANPVIAGDEPDPTILHARGAYYATATVSAWAPLFTIFRSTDLVNWQAAGAVLPAAPAWASGKFWAPELVRGPRGGYLAYYSAARAGGKPCIGVASATRPQGPYADRGRAFCPPGGAIDAAPVRDEKGRPWLGYKRAGSGHGIAIVRLTPDGLHATGHSRVLVRPDQPWEHGVTEGPAFLRRGGTWYLFYAGGTCCRPPCTYVEAVARAPSLTGPYVKDPSGPVLRSNTAFKCPGHGTLVDAGAAGTFLLHHAYRADDVADARRSVLLDPVAFGPDGWPVVAGGEGPLADAGSPFGVAQKPPDPSWSDAFASTRLDPQWQWLFDRVPAVVPRGGALRLGCAAPASAPALVARQATVDRFAAVARIDRASASSVGFFVHDQGAGLRGVEVHGAAVRAVAVTRLGRVRRGPPVAAPPGPRLSLLVSAVPGGDVGLGMSGDGRTWSPVPAGPAALGTAATRVALACHGGGTARFLAVRLRALPAP